MNAVRMYTTQVCPYCHAGQGAAEAAWRRADRRRSASTSTPPSATHMMELTGRRTVPQIFIGDTHVGGCDDLIALDQRGGLLPLLGAGRAAAPDRGCAGGRARPSAIIAGCGSAPSGGGLCHFTGNTTMADDATPVFQIQRMYLKDLSLEQPNSPQILLEQQQPQVDINLAMAAERRGRRHLRSDRHRHRDDQGQGQDAVPGRSQAGRHLRDPQRARRAAAGHHQHRLPADDLPVPARHRLRRLHPRRLPADPADRSQLPGHVRGAAGAGRGAAATARASSPAPTEATGAAAAGAPR